MCHVLTTSKAFRASLVSVLERLTVSPWTPRSLMPATTFSIVVLLTELEMANAESTMHPCFIGVINNWGVVGMSGVH